MDREASAVLARYSGWVLRHARYERMADGQIYGEVPTCDGVWALGETEDATKYALAEVVGEWLAIRYRDRW